MDMRVSVPSYLLEDIFRLVDYLGNLTTRDTLRFQADYSDCFSIRLSGMRIRGCLRFQASTLLGM